MKKTQLIRSLCVLGMALASQTAWGRPFCTAKDVSGPYAFVADGNIMVPNTPITGPFMRMGWVKFDGAGSIQASTLAVYNGINFGQETLTGTYTVDTDCTIELHVNVPAPINQNSHFKGRVANDGEDIFFMLVDVAGIPLPTSVAGHGRRRKLNTCSAKDFTGPYRVEAHGWLNLPIPNSPFAGPAVEGRLIGRLQGDGAGNGQVYFMKNIGGFIQEEGATATYVVNPDCTFAISYILGGGPIVLRGSFIGLGEEAFVVMDPPGYIVNLPPFGNVEINTVVATGTMIQQTVANSAAVQ